MMDSTDCRPFLASDQTKCSLSLEEAYESCRRETAKWAKTFYLGTLLLPPEKRRAIWAIYVWCRRTDEIMDSPEALQRPHQDLVCQLDLWEEKTRALFQGTVQSPLDLVMSDTIQKFSQPLQPHLDMIDGMRMDLDHFRYKHFSDLQLYCYRVAGTVGLMSQNVMGLDHSYTSAPWSLRADTSEAAIALGIANQLTNILRDVGEDRYRGRIYLPLEDLERFNYTESQLMAGELNDNWIALMRFQIARARSWFQHSEDGIRYLSPDARWPIWTSLRLYRSILCAIELNGYDVFSRRAFVSRFRKLIDLPFSFFLAQL